MKAICIRTLMLATSMAWLFGACKNDAPKTTPPTTTSTEKPVTQPTPAKPEMYLYQTIYDGIQLRAEPTMKGTILTKFVTNEIMEGSGEKTKEKFQATLGGMVDSHPFYAATTTTPAQLKGWVYGGGIQTIYAGTRASSPDLGKLSQLGQHLAKLDVKKITSGESAWQYVLTNLADAKGPLADAASAMLMRFLRRMDTEGKIYTLSENIKMADSDWEKVNNGTYDMTTSKALKSLDAAGFRLTSAEGSVFPILDTRKFLTFFGKNASPAMKQYYEMAILEEMKPYTKDAGLVISHNELVERCIAWERFNTANPYFIGSNETQLSEKWLGTTLINGQNNTPAFSYENSMVEPEFAKAWAYVLQKYPESKLGKTVAEFTKLLAAEGNKDTDKVQVMRNALYN